MNLAVHITICCVLFAVFVGLILYKKYLEDYCDHNIHLHNDAHDSSIISAQAAECKRIEVIDKTKGYLLTAAILYALAIIAIASYSAWNS